MSNLTLTGAGPEAGTAFVNPSSIAGLEEWFKADAGTSTTTDGVAISQWNDQSGNARHLTQATGSLQPLYKAAIQNGLPVVRFDGVDDFLSGVAGTYGALGAVFVVASFTTATTVQQLIHSGHEFYRDTTTLAMFQGTAVQTASPAITMSVLTARFNGDATSTIRRDGSVLTTANAGAGTQNVATLNVGRHSTGIRFLSGDIAEIAIYSAALSTSDVTNVETYLKTKWATP